MSLATMNKEQLHGIARALLIEVDPNATKNEILAKFAEEKVTKEDYENLEVPPEVDPNTPLVESPTEGIVTAASLRADEEVVAVAPAQPDFSAVQTTSTVPVAAVAPVVPDSILLKYERKNPTFQIRQYQFSREHPFQLVKNADAEYIVRNVPGFRPAMASEAEEFYS